MEPLVADLNRIGALIMPGGMVAREDGYPGLRIQEFGQDLLSKLGRRAESEK